MVCKHIWLNALALFVCGTLSTIADDLETNIVNFPTIGSDYYNPDAAVNSANALIVAGREKACAALEKVAEDKIDVNGNNQIFKTYSACAASSLFLRIRVKAYGHQKSGTHACFRIQ
jgi:hypothetical protein